MEKRVSFDFDDTLSRRDVQEYCLELINKGVEVFVVTMRYNELLKHLYTNKPHNNDLYIVTDLLGIKRENIIFTNMKNKSYFISRSKLLWHLDDLESVIKEINNNCEIKCIDVNTNNWKELCNKFI